MRFFLSAGSNIEPKKYIPLSIKTLKEKFSVIKVSSVYETDPVGAAGDRKFWNYAAEIEFAGNRSCLTAEIREIEESLGRRRDPQNKFAPRCIDIDILPQSDYQKQAFIMVPLAEIAPKEKDPETEKTFEELAENFKEEKKSYKKIAV